MEKVIFWAVAGLVLVSSLLLGKWFSNEARRIKLEGRPLYEAYFTKPGIIILVSITGIMIYYFTTN